jgi:hypothetical protein
VAPLLSDLKYILRGHLLRRKKQGGQVATSLGVARTSPLRRFALIEVRTRREVRASVPEARGSGREGCSLCALAEPDIRLP